MENKEKKRRTALRCWGCLWEREAETFFSILIFSSSLFLWSSQVSAISRSLSRYNFYHFPRASNISLVFLCSIFSKYYFFMHVKSSHFAGRRRQAQFPFMLPFFRVFLSVASCTFHPFGRAGFLIIHFLSTLLISYTLLLPAYLQFLFSISMHLSQLSSLYHSQKWEEAKRNFRTFSSDPSDQVLIDNHEICQVWKFIWLLYSPYSDIEESANS